MAEGKAMQEWTSLEPKRSKPLGPYGSAGNGLRQPGAREAARELLGEENKAGLPDVAGPGRRFGLVW